MNLIHSSHLKGYISRKPSLLLHRFSFLTKPLSRVGGVDGHSLCEGLAGLEGSLEPLWPDCIHFLNLFPSESVPQLQWRNHRADFQRGCTCSPLHSPRETGMKHSLIDGPETPLQCPSTKSFLTICDFT